jgi:hypothetical protein
MRAIAAARVLFVLWFLAIALPARAQSEPPVGVRAAGMGGAFTAVADDASAVFWNPAGLASGSFFSLVVDRNSGDRGPGTGDRGPGTGDRGSATLIALGLPPLGLSYYRIAAGELTAGRDSLVTHHAGVTVLQSLGDRVAVGAALKLVHGEVSSPIGSASSNTFDTDIGVMTKGSVVRLGLSVRNLLEPEFAVPGGGAITLDRRVRAGIAVNTSRRTIAAADVDLTTVKTVRGDWREAALGVEANPAKIAWLRGGFRWNTADGPAAPVGTAGGSLAVYGSILADAQVSFGSAAGNRGWGLGLRFVF